MRKKITEVFSATIFGLIVMYLSYLLRSLFPSLFHVRIDWQAELLAIAILLICGVLALIYKRYTFLIGVVLSYILFYLILLVLVSAICNQGSCL
jgi:hypothetical protein